MARLAASKGATVAKSARVQSRTVLVPYVGPAGSFETVSALAILQHRVPAGFFHNKFVLMGATARDLLGRLSDTDIAVHAQRRNRRQRPERAIEQFAGLHGESARDDPDFPRHSLGAGRRAAAVGT